MIRLSAIAAASAAAVAVVAFTGSAGAASHPRLTGVVGKNNAYKISLSFNGKIAKTLKAGTYSHHPPPYRGRSFRTGRTSDVQRRTARGAHCAARFALLSLLLLPGDSLKSPALLPLLC